MVPTKDPISGATVKRATYMNEEQILELLRSLKQRKEEQEKLAEVQKAAGSVGG